MDCLAEDKGLVQLREGYDRYRGAPEPPKTSFREEIHKLFTSLIVMNTAIGIIGILIITIRTSLGSYCKLLTHILLMLYRTMIYMTVN